MKENLFLVEDILWTAGWSNVQTFAKFDDKPIDSARTTSDVLFNTTAGECGTRRALKSHRLPYAVALQQNIYIYIYWARLNYLSRSPMYYSARSSTVNGSRCPPWGY